MAEPLRQSEVDALLEAIGGMTEARPASAGAGEARSSGAPEPYDFRNPPRITPEQLAGLRRVHESFAHHFAGSLAAFLRAPVGITVASAEQVPFGRFVERLANPTCIAVLSCPPLPQHGCLEVAPRTFYAMLDRWLGGAGGEAFVPRRPLTNIERKLAARIAHHAADALAKAWDGLAHLRPQLDSIETDPRQVPLATPDEPVLALTFDVNVGGQKGSMSLCFPCQLVERIRPHLATRDHDSAHADPESRGSVADRLRDAPVAVTGLLAETTITLSELLNMAPGDVLVTDKPADGPLVLTVEGRKKFLAHLGQSRGHRALKVSRRIQD